MGDDVFEAMVRWCMRSDPWPTSPDEERLIKAFLDVESKRRGYDGWVAALHDTENP